MLSRGDIDNVSLLKQEESKFLGVILSADLKWHKHTDIIINKASKNIGIISKIRHLLPENLTRTLYLTLVDPYISYCNIVWSAPNNTGSGVARAPQAPRPRGARGAEGARQGPARGPPGARQEEVVAVTPWPGAQQVVCGGARKSSLRYWILVN